MAYRFISRSVLGFILLATCTSHAAAVSECAVLDEALPRNLMRVSREEFRSSLSRYLNSVHFLNQVLLVGDKKATYLHDIEFTKQDEFLSDAQQIGIKTLKNKLAHYMREARKGQKFVIAFRDKPRVLMQAKQTEFTASASSPTIPVGKLLSLWTSVAEGVISSQTEFIITRLNRPVMRISPYVPAQDHAPLFIAAGTFRSNPAEFFREVEQYSKTVVVTVNQIPSIQLESLIKD